MFFANGEWLYSGTSDTFFVQPGTNEVKVKMKSINNDAERVAEFYLTVGCYDCMVNNSSGMGNLILDKDGFFEITASYSAISKGKWSGNPTNGGTIYLTEYIYCEVPVPDDEYAQVVYPTGSTIIATPPNTYSFSISADGSLNFTLKNGVSITGSVN